MTARNIFGRRTPKTPVSVDPIFPELALILLVFSVCCAAVLNMLGTASKNSEAEEKKACAISFVQSYCEVYGRCGSAETAAVQVFGDLDDSSFSSSDICFRVNESGIADENGSFTVALFESMEETGTDGLICGNMMNSEIRITWDSGSFSCSSACYKPLPVVINAGNGGAADE